MENVRFHKKVLMPLAHLPTALLCIGYLVYWLEIYLIKIPGGITSPLAYVLFLLTCLYSFSTVVKEKPGIILEPEGLFPDGGLLVKVSIISGVMLCLLILAITFKAALLPPHLPQEHDALCYHLSLPRQHLIRGSFMELLIWHWADLTLMPLDYALAPFSFIAVMPSKVPHFIFIIGLLGISFRIASRLSNHNLKVIFPVVFAVLGSHNIGIQMGTAMLDLVMCYLFLAALDSWLTGQKYLALIEFVFFFWSKPFVPFQITIVVSVLIIIYLAGRRYFKKFYWGMGENSVTFHPHNFLTALRRYSSSFLILSVLIAGPFLFKSLYYAGTPLYPFGTGICMIRKTFMGSAEWQVIKDTGHDLMTVRNDYGYGRSTTAFLRHFWLIAVPERGVNNKFDYPAGLPYLLFIGPFILFTGKELQRRSFMIIPFFIILFWGSWWLGSQQSRFLYVPMTLMLIVTAARIGQPSKVLWVALILSLLFNSISLYRSHKGDLLKEPRKVIRETDREILKMNKIYLNSGRQDIIRLEYPEISFAQFPVVYKRKNP